LDVSPVSPIIPHVNIGASFYDLEFSREIPIGGNARDNIVVSVEQNNQSSQMWKEITTINTLQSDLD
jgi:hypothetical protein